MSRATNYQTGLVARIVKGLIEQLQVNQFHKASRRQSAGAPIGEPPEREVIRISTIFGSAPEFWTVAVSGTEEHFDLEAFEYLHKVPSPC